MHTIPTPNIVVVVKTNVFQLRSSPSADARKIAIAGDVLKSVQPNPIGNSLKTFCCNKIPILVPKNVADIILILFSKGNFLIDCLSSANHNGKESKCSGMSYK